MCFELVAHKTKNQHLCEMWDSCVEGRKHIICQKNINWVNDALGDMFRKHIKDENIFCMKNVFYVFY
jgi:hypothetical protein